MNLGEPTHVAKCNFCGPVGGPYFDPHQASERRKEHMRNRHDPYTALEPYRRDPNRKPFRLPGVPF